MIVIPALDEEATLPGTLDALPADVDGFDEVEWLVVDDGSDDRTSEVARAYGAAEVVRFARRRGLAEAFSAGIEAALARGADVVVNTDADNQYAAAGIPDLVEPILRGEADVVVGERIGAGVAEFSRTKRLLQSLGSAAVRRASGTDVRDAASGFRAYSREAALRLNVLGRFSYTLESLIQAGRSGLAVRSVPVETNPRARRSRLSPSTARYVARSAAQLARAYAMYKPFRTFLYLGAVAFVLALTVFGRFFYYFATGGGSGHVQSLILGAVLMIAAFQLVVLGILGDLLAANRRLLERTLVTLRRTALDERQRARSDDAEPADADAPR
ncbi:MAG TPA: glycosyltransferase family 2 protein [Gaiellaceae bacterium]|nr:glycosyltransferase family 2 protein [Gaiellaceae bacterium]